MWGILDREDLEIIAKAHDDHVQDETRSFIEYLEWTMTFNLPTDVPDIVLRLPIIKILKFNEINKDSLNSMVSIVRLD